MPKLSESQIPSMLPILFKIIDFTAMCWNIYLIITGLVAGWIFSIKDTLGWKQKLVITILYCFAVGVNSTAIYKMYNGWLNPVLTDLKREAQTLDDDSTPQIKEMFQNSRKLFILGGKPLVALINLVAVPVMIYCIWMLK